uniref:Uncharacterized protein n=1 Tax=Timema bartmani TaxID=61472 RepID=A0A7R9EUX5_9NEOP|nr:unnamed protein product [Timema bartmani]
MTCRHPIKRKTRTFTDCCCCCGAATWRATLAVDLTADDGDIEVQISVELFDAVRRRRGRSAAARGDTSEEDEDLGLPRSPCNSPTTADVLLEKGGLKTTNARLRNIHVTLSICWHSSTEWQVGYNLCVCQWSKKPVVRTVSQKQPEFTWASPFKDSSLRYNARTRFRIDLDSQNDYLIARTCLNDGCRLFF